MDLQKVKTKVAAADAAQGTGGLLTKKVDTAVKVMLASKFNPNQIWQSVLVLDASGSMDPEYRAGHVQDAVERALGFSVLVDDDGTVPVVVFDSHVRDTEVKLDNFHGFVGREGIRAGGSTNLAGALRNVAELTGNGDLFSGGGMFSRGGGSPQPRKMNTPVFAIVVTDGRPDSEEDAEDAIRRLSYRAIFVKFIYVGHDARGWAFLEELDENIPVGVPYERGGRLIDNVNAQRLSSLGDGDEPFYKAMLEEAAGYPALARQHGLL